MVAGADRDGALPRVDRRTGPDEQPGEEQAEECEYGDQGDEQEQRPEVPGEQRVAARLATDDQQDGRPDGEHRPEKEEERLPRLAVVELTESGDDRKANRYLRIGATQWLDASAATAGAMTRTTGAAAHLSLRLHRLTKAR